MSNYATLAEFELRRAAALVARDGRPRWVVTSSGRILTHRPEGESVRAQLRGTVVVYTHQPARD